MKKNRSPRWVAVMVTLVFIAFSFGCSDDTDNPKDAGIIDDGIIQPDGKNIQPTDGNVEMDKKITDSKVVNPDLYPFPNCPQPKGVVNCKDDGYKASQKSPILRWQDTGCKYLKMVTSKDSALPNTDLEWDRISCTGPDGKSL